MKLTMKEVFLGALALSFFSQVANAHLVSMDGYVHDTNTGLDWRVYESMQGTTPSALSHILNVEPSDIKTVGDLELGGWYLASSYEVNRLVSGDNFFSGEFYRYIKGDKYGSVLFWLDEDYSPEGGTVSFSQSGYGFSDVASDAPLLYRVDRAESRRLEYLYYHYQQEVSDTENNLESIDSTLYRENKKLSDKRDILFKVNWLPGATERLDALDAELRTIDDTTGQWYAVRDLWFEQRDLIKKVASELGVHDANRNTWSIKKEEVLASISEIEAKIEEIESYRVEVEAYKDRYMEQAQQAYTMYENAVSREASDKSAIEWEVYRRQLVGPGEIVHNTEEDQVNESSGEEVVGLIEVEDVNAPIVGLSSLLIISMYRRRVR